MASLQGEVDEMVVTGFRRREAMVAPWKASFFAMESRREIETCAPLVLGVRGGVGGRRSLAASQSSSTNYVWLANAFVLREGDRS
jgi:hypothetical protein